MRFRPALLPLTMPLILAACFGSGGGGGGSNNALTLDSTPTADFTSFSDITANSLVELSAARSVNYATTGQSGDQRAGVMTTTGYSDLLILTGDAADPNDPESPLEVDGVRLIVQVPGVDGRMLVRDFLDQPTGVGDYGVLTITNDAQAVTDRLVFNNGQGLDYLTFGLWEIGLGEVSVDLGGAAWGARTPTVGAGSMPTVGAAIYTGELIGYNATDVGTIVYIADSTLAADFDAETVGFSTLNTRQLLDQAAFNPDLNITATGTINGNGFGGTTLTLQGQNVADGSFGGLFFGPEAAEAGGWFAVTTVGGPPLGAQDRYFGSFGGAPDDG